MIVVLSDFPTDEPLGPWREASRRQDVVAIRIVDPLERDLPSLGLIAVRDSEGTGRVTVDAHRRRRRLDYAAHADRRRRMFVRWCTSAAIDGHEMSTETEPLRTLMKVFERRAAHRGRR